MDRRILACCALISLLPCLGAQMTESALGAFRKDARAQAQELYAALAAASAKDGRDAASLAESALAAASALEDAAAALRGSPAEGRAAAASALAAAEASARGRLSSLPPFPPPSASGLSRLIASSVSPGASSSSLSALEAALVGLCPPERSDLLSRTGALFRAGGGKARLLWLQALASGLCRDPEAFAALAVSGAQALNGAAEAQGLLRDLERCAALESLLRRSPILLACPALEAGSPEGLGLGRADSKGGEALSHPGPWIDALEPRLARLASEGASFFSLLPDDILLLAYGGLSPLPSADAAVPEEQGRGLSLLLSFEAALQATRQAPPSTRESAALAADQALLAISASPSARGLLSSPARQRERGEAAAWVAERFRGWGLEARLSAGPSRLAILSPSASTLDKRSPLFSLLAGTAERESTESGTLAAAADSRPLAWRWLLLSSGSVTPP